MQSEPSLRSENLSCRCTHPQGEQRPYTDGDCTQCVCKTFQLGEQQPVVINDPCKCGHDRFCHCLTKVDGICSEPECACEAYVPVAVETVELSCTCGAVGVQAHDGDCDVISPNWCHPQGLDVECPCTTGCGCCEAQAPPPDSVVFERHIPPQPERRPPLSVAYSVAGGHAYEIYVPGDASVTAEDGILKIQHPEAQVLAIVRVAPIKEA